MTTHNVSKEGLSPAGTGAIPPRSPDVGQERGFGNPLRANLELPTLSSAQAGSSDPGQERGFDKPSGEALDPVKTRLRSRLDNVSATRIIVTTIGVIFGIAGFNHGFFEFLQGNTPTDGLIIQAIGEAHRFWPLGTEEAFTIVPNFLISGILSMVLGLTIVVWSLGFIHTRHGRTVFLALFILLFLVGGGIGQVAFFLPAWALGTRMDNPLNWWRGVLPRRTWPPLSRLWMPTLVVSSAIMLMGLQIAIFGFVPGITDPERIQNASMTLVLTSAVLNVIAFIAGFGHELHRQDQNRGGIGC